MCSFIADSSRLPGRWRCFTNIIYRLQTQDLVSKLLGLERRLPQLAKDIAALESDNDEEMYEVISLQLIKNELSEMQQFVDKLNSSVVRYQSQSASAAQQVPPV